MPLLQAKVPWAEITAQKLAQAQADEAARRQTAANASSPRVRRSQGYEAMEVPDDYYLKNQARVPRPPA
jgi:hypothetical protein